MEIVRGNMEKEFFYLTVRIPINEELKIYIGIFEKGNYEVHPFTEYLTDRIGNFTLKNKSFNTIKNFHLTFIIRFLNFIFNYSKTPINYIEDLRIDMVEEFLDNFSQGTLPNDRSGTWKSRETVDRATYAISHFVYWLFWKKEKNSQRKKFKMKYIKTDDFQFENITKHSKGGYTSKEIRKLMNIVTPNVSNRRRERIKVIIAGNYSVSKLIELSIENDPMLTFGIVLGAYAGLRVGDIVQLHEGRIKGLYKDKCFGSYIDFTYDTILRSDNILTGSIKTKRNVPIYPGCAEAIFKYYEIHLNYLKNRGFYPNEYGAIFIDSKGRAMTYKTYLRRFDKLIKLLDIAIKKEVLYGNREAIKENQILDNNKITPHSLRHYFKQLIENSEQNPRIIQYYMAHKSLDSQSSYAFALSTKEGIRKCQNQLYITTKNNILE